MLTHSSKQQPRLRLMQTERTIDQGNVHITYNPALLPEISENLFDPGSLEREGLLDRRTAGRQSAFVFRIDNRGFVLRHYWRGGLVGRIVDDAYVWAGLTRSRPLREWHLTRELSAAGLPVPQPVAARVIRKGLYYRGDFITAEILDTVTLAERLAQEPLNNKDWERIAETIANLHAKGAYHSDLNASNILLDNENTAHVIDWDKGYLRQPAAGWQENNIARLLRSLEKNRKEKANYHYTDEQGTHIISAYKSSLNNYYTASKA